MLTCTWRLLFFPAGHSERFELFARGLELINAYTEQNDPDKLKQAFDQQGNISDVNDR